MEWQLNLNFIQCCFKGDDPEQEFGDNLKSVDIPEDLQKQFHEEDEKEIKQAEEEKLKRTGEPQSENT